MIAQHHSEALGGELPPRLIHAARRAQWAHTVSFDFEAGDLMVLDNYIAQHGRFSFNTANAPSQNRETIYHQS